MHTATYSPEDNKIRITPAGRLSTEDYAKVKAAGFSWAPKQGIFVAPMWTPSREDIAIEFCGEIDDEDSTLAERAEARAERFEDYSEKRANEAKAARDAVSAITDHIPLGSPILVGHHSERHARKNAERIESNMRRAVNMWETSQYWQSRAAGALRHAKYKELPGVRARRIKGLEADKRKVERQIAEIAEQRRLWAFVDSPDEKIASISREKRGYLIAGRMSGCGYVTKTDDGKTWSAYDVLAPSDKRFSACPVMTVDEVLVALDRAWARSEAHAKRWIAHYENRIAYEQAMLGETGYVEPPKAPTKAALPLLNYPGTVSYKNPWQRGEVVTCEAHSITKAQLASIHADYKGTRISADGTHRVRTAMISGHKLAIVFITDSKQHPRPGTGEAASEVDARINKAQDKIERQANSRAAVVAHNRQISEPVKPAPRPEPSPEAQDFQNLKSALKAGVQVVTANQLFPTPPDLAARMVELADLLPGRMVLEPSAGTGNLIRAITNAVETQVIGYEINQALCDQIDRTFPELNVTAFCKDFLEVTEFQGCYPRILMNPPFENASDIKHIQHAMKFLAPGGRLVAICANGPRQQATLKPLADYWEDLPQGTFKEQGTNVNTALLVITN